jgi:uncharacterized glyoxalase superfamily protein PhnB
MGAKIPVCLWEDCPVEQRVSVVTLGVCSAEVDSVPAEAEAAGATVPRPGGETFWGGYTGVFVDPEGHPWEVAHNPRWTPAPDGPVQLGS